MVPARPVSSDRPTSAWAARWAALLVALAVMSLLGLFVWSLGKRSAGTVGSAPIDRRLAPPFTLPLFDGTTFELATTSGRPVVLNFWASWCLPCEDEAPALERMAAAYRDRVVFVGIDVQDTESKARAFLRRFGVTYPNGRDASGEISVEYGMSGVPESYFIDREGRLARKWQGPLDDDRLRGFLDELLR